MGLTLVRDDDHGTAGDRDILTARQREILEFILKSIGLHGYPPTLREIGKAFGIRSTNGVNDHLRALEKKGYLQREDMKSRTLRPTAPMNDTVDVPVLGRVAAGQPLLAVRQYEESVKVDRFFIGDNREVFALRVAGHSMIEAGIFDGDYVFVRKQLQATPGEIVVVMIDNEATVKHYHPEGDVIRFQPANSQMKPIIVSKRDFRSVNILGIVVGVYRKLH
jgi:repressor LexA